MATEKLKILFLCKFYRKVNRGVETYVNELSKRLKKNYEVDIFTGSDSENLKKIINGRYDFVIPTNGRLQALKASFGRLFSNYKLVISGQSGIGRDDIFNIAVVKPDVYVALTEYEKKWAEKWAFNTKLIKIPNGVDLDRFSPVGEKTNFYLEKPVILSVGALFWYKRHELSINAVSKLKKGFLLIVGSGPEEENLKKIATKLLGDRFRIIHSDYENLTNIYKSADIFVLPSWNREAFGIVYLEAMASGLPVVAPDDPPRREIIEDAGLFVDVTDPEKYAKAIDRVLAKNWGSIPRKQAEKFSWDKVAKQYEDLFEEIT